MPRFKRLLRQRAFARVERITSVLNATAALQTSTAAVMGTVHWQGIAAQTIPRIAQLTKAHVQTMSITTMIPPVEGRVPLQPATAIASALRTATAAPTTRISVWMVLQAAMTTADKACQLQMVALHVIATTIVPPIMIAAKTTPTFVPFLELVVRVTAMVTAAAAGESWFLCM